MSPNEPQHIGSIVPQYQTYQRQKCFIAYTQAAPWGVDLMSACNEILSLPEYNLEADYAGKHFDPDVTLRQKARELIANARYGLYDLSCWWDELKGKWQLPRNVLIELGIAIALNRPTLLLRHISNEALELPECLKSVSQHILTFGGEFTLKDELRKRLPQWLNTPPEQDWWNRYCIFGNRKCEYREVHPRSRQWGQRELRCLISDGTDPDRPDFRRSVEKVLERFNDVNYTYLDSFPLAKGYDFLLCSHCQATRSKAFAIYRITPHTPAETFIAIGMSIALEDQFGYPIPTLLLTEKVEALPSLLSDREACVARNNKEMKDHLLRFMPSVMRKVRELVYKPKPLPFIDITHSNLPDNDDNLSDHALSMIQAGRRYEEAGQVDSAIEAYKEAIKVNPGGLLGYVRLSEVYARVNKLQEAEECIRRVLSSKSTDPVILTTFANILLKAQKYDKAISAFEEAISVAPSEIIPRIGLAEAAKAIRDYDKAERIYREAISLFPPSLAAQTGLAELLLAQGKFAEAERIFRDVVKQFPENVVAIEGLANTLKLLGRLGEAERFYRAAIERFPEHISVRNGLAGVLVGQNKRLEAEKVYRETLNLFPADAEAQSGLRNLTVFSPSGPRDKVRIYDLAKELKMESKRIIEEVRREGVDVSVPSNRISRELAEKIRNKYFPKKEPNVHRAIRVVKKARPLAEEEPATASDTQPAPSRYDLKRESLDPKQSKKIYVGNLSFRTTSDELFNLFSKIGNVESASVVEDRETGRSRGFGFVELSTPEEAANAIRQLNGTDWDGRKLSVSEARPRNAD